jgi:hypothetical protein
MAETYESLQPRQQKFVDAYLKLGCRREAYREAGFSVEGRGWTSNARNLFIACEGIIKDRIELGIGEGAILALAIIKQIMQDESVSPAVRLNAAKDYLNRAGYDVPVEQQVVVRDETKLTDAELNAKIQELLKTPGSGLKAVK